MSTKLQKINTRGSISKEVNYDEKSEVKSYKNSNLKLKAESYSAGFSRI